MEAGALLAGGAAAAPVLLRHGLADAAAPANVPMVGAIPEAMLTGTVPTPKFTGEIKVGSIFPRTGANGYLGEEAWRGAELA